MPSLNDGSAQVLSTASLASPTEMKFVPQVMVFAELFDSSSATDRLTEETDSIAHGKTLSSVFMMDTWLVKLFLREYRYIALHAAYPASFIAPVMPVIIICVPITARISPISRVITLSPLSPSKCTSRSPETKKI